MSLPLRVVFFLSVLLSMSGCQPELDLPWFVQVDAWCDSTDPETTEDPLPFDIWARVNHDRGPEAVEWVWVDVSLVEYDGVDGTIFLTPIASFDLLQTETVDEWAVRVESGATPLDCAYDFEYHFLFSVEDDDGDRTQADFIN
jgi:hypothetical protein